MRKPIREQFFRARKWIKDGMKHRASGPALEYDSGEKIWVNNDDVKYVETGRELDSFRRLRPLLMKDFPGYEDLP